MVASDAYAGFVAERAGRVVGWAFGGPARRAKQLRDGQFSFEESEPLPSDAYAREIHGIFLLDSAQRCGFGRRLLHEIATDALARNERSIVVWTLHDNAAGRAFYEKLGGKQIDELMHVFDGVRVPEVCYGWLDAEQLITIS
jgi:GNAT superfamily N-acetyltransferase